MVFLKVLFMWSSMPVFGFIWYTLMELFRKPDNWQQIYKQTSSTLYTSNDVSRRKKHYVITWLQNSCWIVLFLKKYRSSYRIKISEAPQENNCVGVFFYEVAGLEPVSYFKKDSNTIAFLCESLWNF